MPGDPKQCREHAKRCWALASEITNPVLKESLTDAAQRWALLATELETIHSLLEALVAQRGEGPFLSTECFPLQPPE